MIFNISLILVHKYIVVDHFWIICPACFGQSHTVRKIKIPIRLEKICSSFYLSFLGTVVPQYEVNPVSLSDWLPGPVSYRLPIGRAT